MNKFFSGLNKKGTYYLLTGQTSILIAILLNRFAPETPVIHFFTGVFTGISMVMNIAAIVMHGKAKKGVTGN